MSEELEVALENILRLMGFPAPVKRDEAEGRVTLRIESEEGILIGRKGKTLEALEWVMRVVAGPGREVQVECGDYRERQRRYVEDQTRRAIERVLERGQAVAVGPYLPAERKIVHQMVSREQGLETQSEGEGWEKLVHIFPQRADRQDPDPSK